MTSVLPSMSTAHHSLSPSHSLTQKRKLDPSPSKSDAMETNNAETTPKKPQHKHPKLMAQQSAAKQKAAAVQSQIEAHIDSHHNTQPVAPPKIAEPQAQPISVEEPLPVKQLKQAKAPTRTTTPPPEIKVTPTPVMPQQIVNPQNLEAKKQAVQGAASRYAHYASMDGLYFNYIIPCLPMHLINPEVHKESEE